MASGNLLTVNEELSGEKEFCLEEGNLQAVIFRGYDSWEESCLAKFSEFLGFSTTGHEKDIIGLSRKLINSRSQGGHRGQLSSSKCERELKNGECIINYNSQGNGKVSSRDKGIFC